MTKTHRSRFRTIFSICFIVFILYLVFSIYASAHILKTSKYQIQSGQITNPMKIAFITDLHGSEFGKDNKKLVSLISKQQPDLICITGDLVDKTKDTLTIAEKLIQQLSNIAPVYVSMGNHEYEYQYCTLEELKTSLQTAGAILVDYDYYDLSVKENHLRIGGFYGYGCPYEGDSPKDTVSKYLAECQNTDAYKILLSHMPHGWYHAGSLDFWNFNLVLCGHTHGGQIRLPIIGGLFAPDLEFFPGKERGVYQSEDKSKTMILSTGLGNTEIIPRINNRPEIVLINLTPIIHS